MTTFYRVAPDTMRLSPDGTRRDFVGFSEVTYCTRPKFRDKLRAAFESRAKEHFLYVWHKPEPTKGGTKYEGAKIQSWTTTGRPPQESITFSIDRNFHSVPISEVVEMAFFEFND